MKYERVVALLAARGGMALEDALAFFYDSDTYMLISGHALPERRVSRQRAAAGDE